MKKLFLLFTALLLVVSCNQPTGDEDLTVDETPVVVEEKVESEKKETVVEETPTETKKETEKTSTEEKELPKETKTEVPSETKTEPKVEVPTETPSEVQTPTEEPTETDEENTEEESSEENESENEQEEIPVEDKWIKVLKAYNIDEEHGSPTRFAIPKDADPKDYIFGDDTDPSVDYDVLKFEYVKTVNLKENEDWCFNNGDKRNGRYKSADVYDVFVNEKYDGDYFLIYYKDIYTANADYNIAYSVYKIEDVYYLYSATRGFNKKTNKEYFRHGAQTVVTINHYED